MRKAFLLSHAENARCSNRISIGDVFTNRFQTSSGKRLLVSTGLYKVNYRVHDDFGVCIVCLPPSLMFFRGPWSRTLKGHIYELHVRKIVLLYIQKINLQWRYVTIEAAFHWNRKAGMDFLHWKNLGLRRALLMPYINTKLLMSSS